MAIWTLVGSSLTSTVEYTREYTATPASAYEEVVIVPETIEAQIERIAKHHQIASTTLYNLAMSESSLGVQRSGDDGKSCGIVHFHKDYFPEENSRCEDDEYILNRAAEMIANDECYLFTPCNCWSFARSKVKGLPSFIKDLVPNSDYPRVGGIIIMDYDGNPHFPVVLKVIEEGVLIEDANFEPAKIEKRLLTWEYLSIHNSQYWAPDK